MNGFRPYDALDAFDALPQNQEPQPMTEAEERAALDALLGISRETAPLEADELLALLGDAA